MHKLAAHKTYFLLSFVGSELEKLQPSLQPSSQQLSQPSLQPSSKQSSMHKLVAHKTYFLQALDLVDELRGVDGKERQLVRELKDVESLQEDFEEKVEVLQVYHYMWVLPVIWIRVLQLDFKCWRSIVLCGEGIGKGIGIRPFWGGNWKRHWHALVIWSLKLEGTYHLQLGGCTADEWLVFLLCVSTKASNLQWPIAICRGVWRMYLSICGWIPFCIDLVKV